MGLRHGPGSKGGGGGVLGMGQVKRGVLGTGQDRTKRGGGVLDTDQVKKGVFTAAHTCTCTGHICVCPPSKRGGLRYGSGKNGGIRHGSGSKKGGF